MININKRHIEIEKLLRSNYLSKKIEIYFSTKVAEEGYDPYEENYTKSELNPAIIKGYVRDVKPESLIWKQYGLSEIGAKEIIVEERYAEWFRNCMKVKISSDEYHVYTEAQGNRFVITGMPFKLVKIVLKKVA